MCLGELLTLNQLNIPVKVVVFRNESLAFVEMEMKAAGLLDYGCVLANPDFAMIAKAAGIMGVSVGHPKELEEALASFLDYPGPAVAEIFVPRQELSVPPSITRDQVVGFGLFTLKAVLHGRGGELLDLTKTNLFR